jgi:hypothetical protein
MSKKVECECNYCHKKFYIFRAWLRNGKGGKYCCNEHKWLARRGKRPSNYSKIQKICEECGKEYIVKKYREETAKFCSYQCMADNRGRRMRGENHPFWKGGITDKPWKEKRWVKLVKKRDNYKCQICGSNKDIQAHHIKPYKDYPELRYDINNGITVCIDCHVIISPINLHGLINGGHKWRKNKWLEKNGYREPSNTKTHYARH